MGADHGERRGQTHVWNGGHRLLITASPPISLSVVIASQFACGGPPSPSFPAGPTPGLQEHPRSVLASQGMALAHRGA